MNIIEFNFSATKCNGWPKLKFYIDGNLYENYKFISDSADVKLLIDLPDANHILQIELYGKTYNNTFVQNDVIIKDQVVTLDSIKIDNVKLPDLFLFRGRFTNNPDTPQLTWGINGFWSWTFSTPIINWAVNLKNSISQTAHQNFTITSEFANDKNTKLLHILKIMEQELDNDTI